MPNTARPVPTFPAPTLWLAVGLCVVLAAGRSLSGWAALSSYNLPDTDDVMRLVQIRDWLGGQGFFDLTQYRLGGAGGTPMHWSRLGDIGPAAIILAARPFLGAGGAELAALILWPSLLFLGFMLLSGSIARTLGGDRAVGVAIVLAALAWPAAALFVPGRIDHHGLQLVLLLIAVRHMVGTPSRRSGAMAGAAIATSLAVGVELVVPLGILCGVISIRWVHDGDRRQLSGLSLGLLGGLAAMAVLAPSNWIYPACDAFTRQSAVAGAVGALAMAVLAHTTALSTLRIRVAAAGGIGLIGLFLIVFLAPACLADPYAAVDPVIRTGWMSRVEEARGLMALSLAEWIGMTGLALVALVATASQVARQRDPDWVLLATLILGSVLLSLIQARAIHAAAALAPAVLAPLVANLRGSRPALAPIAWLVSIGISYPLLAKTMPTAAVVSQRCDASSAMGVLAKLPAATVLAPIDMGPRLLIETDHHVLAAPYHRNAIGIRAWLDAELNLAPTSDYIVDCRPGGQAMLRRISASARAAQ